MLRKTSTSDAPWYVIPANDKKYARVAVIEGICKQLSRGVDLRPQPLDERALAEAKELFEIDPTLISEMIGRTE